MKKCSYCGAEYADEARVCAIDETPLTGPQDIQLEAADIEEILVPPPEGLAGLEMGFSIVEGFSRPDWRAVRKFVSDRVAKEDLSAAWKYIATIWLNTLAEDLGGDSAVYESDRFSCLSDLGPDITKTLLDYAETVVRIIRSGLKDAAWSRFHGKHVLLFFSDPDDYYAYISYFGPDGTDILTSGVFLRGGYAHIALPYVDTGPAQRTLVHELCHNLLCHLSIPLWLNEGIAVAVEYEMSGGRLIVDREMADRQRNHWNEINIQSFWSGKSYHVPGDDSELSYRLGHILVHLLAEERDFVEFVKNADWRDAGQDASQCILNRDLGEVLGGFLGPGNWRPQRKAIAEQQKSKAGG
ncbi:MAG TPA: hypothetical protein VH280_01070 [Verrucomicrobiae bacterium]|jgi:hypothetical protein|nr:hypothetical protein [Verrucomicrobiae bacterium]